jgi:uncharacterized membrane protein YedE/YeeE
MPEFLFRPLPWYIACPLLGLFAPLLLYLGNRVFGVSSNLRHMCAAIYPKGPHFAYDWKHEGGWNLAFAGGIVLGGMVAGALLRSPDPIAIADATRASLAALGITDFSGLMPRELFAWASLATPSGWIFIVGGGFLVGFGTAYGGGCTSGHGISGVADLQVPSFIALAGFFVGGIATTYLLLPLVLGGGA